jgi:condensin complex subunit 1
MESNSREIAKRDYTDKDKTSKSVSKFLLKYSELQPKQILKHMSLLCTLFDVDSHAIRSSMVEVLANLIHQHLAHDDSPAAARNLEQFYDIILQRFHDTSPFVRTRVLKVLGMLTQ